MIEESKRLAKTRHLVIDFDKNRTAVISFQIHEWSKTIDYDVNEGVIKAGPLDGEIAVFSEYQEPKSGKILKVIIAKYQVSGFRRVSISDSGTVISNISKEEGEISIDGNKVEFKPADEDLVRIPVGHQRFHIRVTHESTMDGGVTKVTPFIRITSATHSATPAANTRLSYKPETAGGDW